jgi:hypothetical protein
VILIVLLLPHQEEMIIVSGVVAVLVAEIIADTFPRVHIGVIAEIESFLQEFGPGSHNGTFGNKLLQDPVIPAQGNIHIPVIRASVSFYAVVVTVAAHVGAEFFVYTALNGVSTLRACFTHSSV